MRRLVCAATLAAASLTACGGRGPGGEPSPRNSAGIARPLEVYQQLGMLAGSADFPVVARFATLRGPADSTLLLLSISMPNSAVRFQRDESGFTAEYRVHAALSRDTLPVAKLERRESVRVGSFAETSRTEESVVFQDMLTLLPGTYTVRLDVGDLNSSRGFRAVDTLVIPSYPRDDRMATPLLVYQASGRTRLNERPDMIVNPRNTVPYGTDALRVYLEMYGVAQPDTVSLRLVDDAGAAIWTTRAPLVEGDTLLRNGIVDMPAAALPVGKLWLEVRSGPDAPPHRTPVLVTISDQWMVTNFADVLRFVDYIADPAELDSLRKAVGIERRELWDRFWARRDPLPATPANEFRDQFFERVRIATDQFAEGTRAGWETDRGQVFIVLGAPDNTLERHVGRDVSAQPNFIEWLYDSLPGGRLVLQFIDRTGFGHYELTQSSESSFRTVAARLRPRA